VDAEADFDEVTSYFEPPAPDEQFNVVRTTRLKSGVWAFARFSSTESAGASRVHPAERGDEITCPKELASQYAERLVNLKQNRANSPWGPDLRREC